MKTSWDLEAEVDELTRELNRYRFESGDMRDKIRQEVALDCIGIAKLNHANSTAESIRIRYGIAPGEIR